MAETNGNQVPQRWTNMQAYILAVICLVVGFGVGYLLRGSGSSAAPASAGAGEQPAAQGGAAQSQPLSPEQLKAMADKHAEPLLAKLASNPKDPNVLAQLGNLYYDAKLYPTAIDYYQKALAENPKDPAVRTDLATAMFYVGDIDHALGQFDQALKDDPKNWNALFNRGITKWQGKMDIEGALADWERLLKENPGYENADQVRQFIEGAKKHRNIKPGETTNKPAM